MSLDLYPQPRPVRVLHVASGDLWGGAEAVVFALALEQQRTAPGSVACVTMNDGILAEKLRAAGVRTWTFDERTQGTARLTASVVACLREFAPRIVHAHRQKENVIALLAALRHRPRPRLVTTVHGLPEPIRGSNTLRRRLVALANRWAVRAGFDAIVSVSHEIQATLQNLYSAARVTCIHNGIPVQRADDVTVAGERRTASGPLRLLALGRLVPIKRFERLGELSDALVALGGMRPVVTLAGDGPLQRELRIALGADDGRRNVRMPGFVSGTEALLQATDALVMTSDHEGVPMAVLEALAQGVPVFGFKVGGLPEIATTGVPMQLSEPYDTAAMARDIAHYFTVNSPGTRSRPPPDWEFDIRQCARGYQLLYERLAR